MQGTGKPELLNHDKSAIQQADIRNRPPYIWH